MIARHLSTLLGKHPQTRIACIKSITKPQLHSFSIQNSSKSPKELQQRFKQIRMHTTMSEYPGLNIENKDHVKNQVRLIDDQETGLKFLVQTPGFVGCADMAICSKVGTQDENQNNAGSLEYLKSFVHMKPSFEQLVGNYQILNQTGATFDLNYDSMTVYAKCSFLQEDQDLMINLLLDLVLQQKNMFEDNFVTQIDLSNINQLVRRTAFKNRGLGMPGKGIGNTLKNEQFKKFQKKIAPKNTIISMSNITDPSSFIGKVKQKIKSKYPEFLNRVVQPTPKSAYVGGLGSFETNQQLFEFAIAFPSVNSKHKNMELYNILRILLGSASSFSSGGPGKGMHSRCTKYLLNQVACVQKASFINQHFDEFGLFGLTVGGPHDQTFQVIDCTLHELSKLVSQISQQQLNRAKHILISSIYQNIQRQPDRLEELTKHIFYYDKIKIYEFQHNIRKVTAKEIQAEMKRLFNQKPTFVYSGNNDSLKKLPTYEQLHTGFKKAIENQIKKK